MTLKEITALRNRLTNDYRLIYTTRNILILNFEKEYDRHVKLICKKQDPKQLPADHILRISLRESLIKSRNMKRFQKEMNDAKTKMAEIQISRKIAKNCFKATQRELSEISKQESKPMRWSIEHTK